jgi:hypothetical protein
MISEGLCSTALLKRGTKLPLFSPPGALIAGPPFRVRTKPTKTNQH